MSIPWASGIRRIKDSKNSRNSKKDQGCIFFLGLEDSEPSISSMCLFLGLMGFVEFEILKIQESKK